MSRKNPLETYFEQNQGRQIHKWHHYFEIYDRHFRRFRGKPVTVVEFGVQYGGSLQMWRDYFGPEARLFGIDIDPRCKQWEEPGTRILIGDQADRSFLREVAKEVGPIDVLIEDGGHHPDQQIATFEVLYKRVKNDGVFLIEDLHTSYWGSYSGGRGRRGTFMERAKALTDQLNAYHSTKSGFAPNRFTRTTDSIHFYDSIVVFEKGERPSRPTHEMTGVASWDPADHTPVHPRLSTRAEMGARGLTRRARRAAGSVARRAGLR